MSNAQIYNEKRGIVFRTYHNVNLGPDKAFEYLEGYKRTLGNMGYCGLKAELEFYHKYRKEFKLVVAGDMGDHTDFSMPGDTCNTRIDVTTSFDVKTFRDYEPFVNDGEKYKIALIDKSNWELVDMIDIAFPKCEICGGYLFKIGALMGENFNRHGESQWSHDQKFINVCQSCNEFSEIESITTSYLFQVSEYAENIPDDLPHKEYLQQVSNYKNNCYNYLKKIFDPHLMGLAEYKYKTISRDGDGYWGFDLLVVNNFIKDYLDDFIETGIIE